MSDGDFQGDNQYGQLGQGHTTDKKSPANVDYVDFGTDFDPKEAGCGAHHCCSLSLAASLKCWGLNNHGQLGYGDTSNRGDQSGELGDNLEVVQLPTDFFVEQLAVMSFTTCAKSTDGVVVCFGRNDKGTCGVGHSDNIGDEANEMGDYLVAVDLGADFGVASLGGGGQTVCAVSTAGALKWFVSIFSSSQSALSVRSQRVAVLHYLSPSPSAGASMPMANSVRVI